MTDTTITCSWELEDSVWLTEEIYKIVMAESEATAKIEAKKGSLLLTIVIGVGIPAMKALIDAIKERKKEKELPQIVIKGDNNTIIIGRRRT